MRVYNAVLGTQCDLDVTPSTTYAVLTLSAACFCEFRILKEYKTQARQS
jgi:hypothetical protein